MLHISLPLFLTLHRVCNVSVYTTGSRKGMLAIIAGMICSLNVAAQHQGS